MLLAAAAEGGLIGAALLLGWWVDAAPFARLRWDLGGLAWGIVATAPLLLGLRWCLATGWTPMVRLIDLVRDRVAPLFARAGPAHLSLLALLAGLGEEALFRGVVQEGLAGVVPTWLALAASSALFGLAHWVSGTYALLAGLVGVYLGALYLVSGNLLAPIVTHALYDLVALSLLARMPPGREVPSAID